MPSAHLAHHIRCGAMALLLLPAATRCHADAEEFYTQTGSDPSFREVMASGDLPRGRNSTHGVKGSRVRVNHDLLKDGPNARRPLLKAIKIHTLGSSAIPRRSFSNWSRWYQEDRNTQVFRLFEGEENVRNSRKLAARVEAFSELKWQRGKKWHEWVGTYTIIKPHACSIFQSKNNINDWSIQLNMSDSGDIKLNHRRGDDKIIARNMAGKPFHIRVRDNGHDYEVYLNGKKEGEGSYARPQGQTSFRWGMYLGAKEVRHDAMILVTGAAVNPRESVEEAFAKVDPKEEDPPPAAPQPPPAPPGLPIPERVWTNRDGERIRAAATYAVGSDVLNLRIGSRWVTYAIHDLSEEDRRALKMALEFIEE